MMALKEPVADICPFGENGRNGTEWWFVSFCPAPQPMSDS